MKRLRPTHVIALSLVLLGLAGSLYKIHFPPGPVADESAYVMMTQSLWHDHDLRYERQDLARAYNLWDQGPYGVILLTSDGGQSMFFGKPFVYSLAAVPFYAVFGAQGLVIFNMALYLAMFWTACWLFRRQLGAIGLLLGGFFFASTSFVYTFWMQPEVFNMACVFFSLAIWKRLRQRSAGVAAGWREIGLFLLAGGLVGAAFVSKEILLLIGVPIGLDLLLQRRWKALLAFAGGLFLVLFVLVGAQWKHTGTWSPYRGVQRRSFDKSFPLESGEDHWQLYRGTSFGSWSGVRPSREVRVLLKDAWYFIVGRHTGLLPYFPFALFLFMLYLLGPKDRASHLLLLAIVGYCLVIFLLRPHNYHGGSGFLGNRYFASIYPAFLFLPLRLKAGRSLIAPFVAAGLWTAPVVATPLQQISPEFGLQVHARMPAFQALPLELTLIAQGRIPGYWQTGWGEGVWIVPRDNFFLQEKHPDGVWLRGASRSEIFILSPVKLERLRFTAQSISADNVMTLTSGDERLRVRFDSAEKRQGTPIELVPKLVERDLWIAYRPDQAPHEYVYRFVLETTDGVMPARRDPDSLDERYLGVFLRFDR